MALHNDTGKIGEDLAFKWFMNNNYTILHRNWRHKHWEVDLIASRDQILHFIEVKTRTSLAYGYPDDNVSVRKINYLIGASEEYLYLNPQWNRIQFDILSIFIKKYPEKVAYFLIEDVYV